MRRGIPKGVRHEIQTDCSGFFGTFTHGYDAETSRPLSITHSGGFDTAFAYLGPDDGRALHTITSKRPGGTNVGRHTYGYDDFGRIDSWQRESLLANPTGTTRSFQWSAHHDFASQLASVAEKSMVGVLEAGWDYGYDLAGNMSSVQSVTASGQPALVTRRGHNALNQIDSWGGPGKTLVRGSIDEPGQVAIGAGGGGMKPARMLEGNRFEAELNLPAGPQALRVSATDPSGNTSNSTYQIQVAHAGARTFSHDTNGNLLSDGIRSYEWDSLSRLKKVTWDATRTTEFKYNALGQRCERIDKTGTTITAQSYYLYDGIELVNRYTGGTTAGNIDRRYFNEGEQRKNGAAWDGFYYTRDHLGSIREVLASNGTLVVRYDYDPYGKRTAQYQAATYTNVCDLGFTGHITLSSPVSGQVELVLTHFRAYDAELGRWLSADPIGEAGGLNLYGYVYGNTLNGWDPYGLEFWSWSGTAGAWAENSANFVAGFGDSATFGATDWLRDQIYGEEGNNVDKCGDSYKWGERTQIATDVATLGASGGLKLALKAKGKQVARAEANRAIRKLPRTQHHINTVIGHPGGVASHFPTGGLPPSIHSGGWNLKKVPPGAERGQMSPEHLRLHSRARIAENAAIGSASLVPGRAMRNSMQDDCD